MTAAESNTVLDMISPKIKSDTIDMIQINQ